MSAPAQMTRPRALPAVSRSQGLGGVSGVRKPEQTKALYEEIVSPNRVYPIVGLSCKFGRANPPVSVNRVREVVWDTAPIYIIESRESRTLDDLLSDLGAYNGAMRVWWPGVDPDSESRWHPLIYDRTGKYGEDTVQRLAEVFAHRPPESLEDLTEEQRTALRLSVVPRPGEAVPIRSATVIPLTTRRDLRRLTSDLRSKRSHPIVVLTLGGGTDTPVFSPAALAERIDPNIPIYIVGTDDLCRRLANALDEPLAVHGGDARVFWPGAQAGADPAEHPRVPAASEDITTPVERLIAALELSRPGVREHVSALERRLQQTQGKAGDSTRDLRYTRTENRALLARAESAERERDAAATSSLRWPRRHRPGRGRSDRDAQHRRAPSPTNRPRMAESGTRPRESGRPPTEICVWSRVHPLCEQTHGDITSTNRMGRRRDLVGCGRAPALQGIGPHQLRQSSTGSAQQVVRSRDGAKAWRAKLNGEGASGCTTGSAQTG